MNWYYADGTNQVGPFDDAALDQLIQNGTVKPETLVWREGMAEWQPLRDARPEAAPLRLKTAVPPPAPQAGAGGTRGGVICAECGKAFPPDEMIRHGNAFICATCKPVFIQKLKEGVRLPGTLEYGGFWIRFAAKFIDGLILGVVFVLGFFAILPLVLKDQGSPSPATVMLQLLLQLGFMVIQGAYQIFFVGKYGATPGKMVAKLRIVNPDGSKIGYGRATGRFFAEILSGLICYIGYLMVAFDDEKRALHDRICSTRVVRT